MSGSVKALLTVAVCLLVTPRPTTAQSVASPDRDALVRQAEAAGAKGLPVAPLLSKIREGIAKGHDAKRIELVVSQMVTHMETADQIVREVEPTAAGTGRETAITLLAESMTKPIVPAG